MGDLPKGTLIPRQRLLYSLCLLWRFRRLQALPCLPAPQPLKDDSGLPAVSLHASPSAGSGLGSGLAVPVNLQPVLINRKLGVTQPCPFTQAVPRRTVGPMLALPAETVDRSLRVQRQESHRPVREGGFTSTWWAQSLLLAKNSCSLPVSTLSLVHFHPCWISLFIRKRPAAGQEKVRGSDFPGKVGMGSVALCLTVK